MMKNLVVQLLVPMQDDGAFRSLNDEEEITVRNTHQYDEIAQQSLTTVRSYANSVGAVYKLIDSWHIKAQVDNSSFESERYDPAFEKCQIIYDDWYLQYDNILYVDADVIVNPLVYVPNIFGEYPQNTLRVYNDCYRPEVLKTQLPHLSINDIEKRYFNAGIMLLSKDIILMYRKYFNVECKWSDQAEWNYCMMKYDFPTTYITRAWNRVPKFTSHNAFTRYYFFHFVGDSKLHGREIVSALLGSKKERGAVVTQHTINSIYDAVYKKQLHIRNYIHKLSSVLPKPFVVLLKTLYRLANYGLIVFILLFTRPHIAVKKLSVKATRLLLKAIGATFAMATQAYSIERSIFCKKYFQQIKNAQISVLYAPTNNLGDMVQTLGQIEALNKLGITNMGFISRESLSKYSGSKTTVLMGGWYMHNPQRFPPSDAIYPIYIGVHIAKEQIIKDNISHFMQFQPIGCRDLHTVSLFKSYGIDAYLSKCFSLMFPRYTGKRINIYSAFDYHSDLNTDYKYQQTLQKYIVLCNEQFNHIPSKHTLLCNAGKNNLPYIIKKTQQTLDRYRRAEMVVTSRLHCALPCRAFGTPLLFFHPNYQIDNRFAGLYEVLNGVDTISENIPFNKAMIDYDIIKDTQNTLLDSLSNALSHSHQETK